MFTRLYRSLARRRNRRNSPVSRAARTTCESLETRRLFAPLIIMGTPLAEVIAVDVADGFITYTVDAAAPVLEPDADYDGIVVAGLGGADTIMINGNGDNPTAVFAGADDDTVIVGDGDLFLNITSPVTIEGDAGTDSLILTDMLGPAGFYAIDATTVDKFGGALITYGVTVEAMTLEASDGADVIDIAANSFVTSLSIKGNDGADVIDVDDTAEFTSVTVDGGAGLDLVTVDADDDFSEAAVTFPTSQDLALLDINAGSSATMAPAVVPPGAPLIPNVLKTAALDLVVGSDAELNLNNNAMIVDYPAGGPSPLPAITALLTSGYLGGTWLGPGINTAMPSLSHGLGYAESATIPIPVVFGAVDDSAVLIRYTRYGDANLSGVVGLDDFNLLAASFGMPGTIWSEGDFNYDGVTNLSDFNRLAMNFGAAAAPEDRGSEPDLVAIVDEL